MLFYTCITTAQLPHARKLAEALQQKSPNAKLHIVLCDTLPSYLNADTEIFGSILFSKDYPLTELSTAYWQFLHAPSALCSAVKPWAARQLLSQFEDDKIVYLDVHSPIPNHLEELERLLDDHPIVVAPHPLLDITDADPTLTVLDPNFFAVKNEGQGEALLRRVQTAAERLWKTTAPLDCSAYDRLWDAAPVLYDRCTVLQDRYFPVINQEANADPLCSYPCAYSHYDNGEPITSAHRDAARSKALYEAYGATDPYHTQAVDCLYNALHNTEDDNADGLYWEEYQEVLNSTSYRLGKKIVDLANKLLPAKLFDKLRGKSAAPALSETMETEAAPVELMPLEIKACESPLFSVVLYVCPGLEDGYHSIHSVVTQNKEADYEILVPDHTPAALTDLVSGLRVCDCAGLDMLSHARGRYVLLIDQYISLTEGFLHQAAERMEQTNAALAQAKLVYSDGKIYEAGGVILQNGQRLSYGFGMDAHLGCVRYTKDIDCPSHRGILLDMEAVNAVGGMGQWELPLYRLADLSFTLRRAGKAVKYLPDLELRDCTQFKQGYKPFAPAEYAYPFAQKWKDVLEAEHIADISEMFYGRDRSKGKKTVFAVDDRIPCYDLSAGDRNTYQYYETMAEMGYNLKIVGDDYVRQEPYATKLEKQGIEIVAADGGGEPEYRIWLRENGKFVDAAYLNRPNNLAKYTPMVKKYRPDARIVYCCHDLHFLRELREHEVNGNKKEAERVRNYAKEEISRMDAADVIFDVSAYEKSILDPQLKHARVEVNPIFIYREFPVFAENFHERKDLLFVGSFKHPGNLDGVAWLCKDIMPTVIKAMPDVKLHLVGAHPTPEIKALANDNVIVHGFLSDEDLAEMYRSCRLSVVPLRFGAGVKGKVLEAMYHGLPIVSTSIGTEGIVDIEQCMENTDGAEAFAAKIIELYPQTDVLTEMGRTNHTYVQEHLGVAPAMELFRRSF